MKHPDRRKYERKYVMIKEFIKLYPDVTEVKTSFCPYRVCPVGAHVDHQFGLVTGFAINKGIEVVYSPTDNGVIELQSMNFEGKLQFHVAKVPDKKWDWADYLRTHLRKPSHRRAVLLCSSYTCLFKSTLLCKQHCSNPKGAYRNCFKR